MQTKPKANSIVTSTLREDGCIVFNVAGEGSIVFNPTKAFPSMRERAEYHGWNQRIPDMAAIPMTDKEGNIIPKATRLRMKFDKMKRGVEHYESGVDQWNLVSTGGGGARSITIEAIARCKDVEYDAAVEMVEAYAERKHGGDTKKALAEMRTSPKVAQAILDIQRERLPVAKADADAMLDEMQPA